MIPFLKKGKFFFLALFLGFIFWQYRSLRTLEGASTLLAGLSVLKLWEMNSKRDFFMFSLISVLFMTAQFLNHQSPLLLLYLVVVSFFFLLLLSFKKDEDSDFKRERLKLLRHLFLTSLPLAAFRFFVFPRIQIGFPFGAGPLPYAEMGFREGITPGDFSKLVGNQEEVFRVQFKGKEPPFEKLYWRGAILSKTDGFSWKKEKGPFREGRFKRTKKLYEYEVQFENLEKSPLFTLAWPLITRHSPGVFKSHNGNLSSLTPRRMKKITFKAVAFEQDFFDLTKREKKNYLQLPPLGEKTKGLAKTLKGNSPQETLAKTFKYFEKGGFFFDLSPGFYKGKRPLEEFLFERKRGYCEHFASSMGVLLRLNGIPTRLVGGFMGGTYNQYGGYYVLKNEDAHAWPEVWVGGRWVNADPTPYIAPIRIKWGASSFFYSLLLDKDFNKALLKRGQNFWRLLSLRVDDYYYQFSQFFHHYGADAQSTLVNSFFSKLSLKRPFRTDYILIALVLSSFFFLAGGLALLAKRNPREKDLLELAFRELCQKLGQTPSKGEGPRDFRDRVKNAAPKKIITLLDHYIEIKYDPSCSARETQIFYESIRSL
jgi:hypothetical protein